MQRKGSSNSHWQSSFAFDQWSLPQIHWCSFLQPLTTISLQNLHAHRETLWKLFKKKESFIVIKPAMKVKYLHRIASGILRRWSDERYIPLRKCPHAHNTNLHQDQNAGHSLTSIIGLHVQWTTYIICESITCGWYVALYSINELELWRCLCMQ